MDVECILPQHETKLLILQSTSFCNIDCEYCILPHRDKKQVLTTDTLSSIIEHLLRDNLLSSSLTILWHTGEPLVPGIQFYKEHFDVISQLFPDNIAVTHSLVTNGTLINADWCEFFLENRIRVGVSCDGPSEIHDLHRTTRSGDPTLSKVVRGINLLNQHGVDFYILSVLTERSLRNPNLLYEFAIDSGIKALCFNIEESEGVNKSKTLQLDDAEVLIAKFFSYFLERSIKDDIIWIREFDQMFLRLFKDPNLQMENDLVDPFKIISIDVDGNWSTFSPELAAAGFNFGNLAIAPISTQIQSSSFQEVRKLIASGVEKCRRECDYFSVCGGGAPSNKYGEHGRFDVSETRYCKLMIKTLSDVCMSKIADLAVPGPISGAARLWD
jgi:uncharacterized protein